MVWVGMLRIWVGSSMTWTWVACHDGVWVDMLIILLGSSWSPRWPMWWFASIIHESWETHLCRCRWDDCIHGSMVPVRTAMVDLVVFLYGTV